MGTTLVITILSVTLPIIGAGFGYLVKHSIEKKKELVNEVTKERREIYQQFVNLIIGLFANSKINQKNSTNTNLKELFNFYKKYVLFASPNVIKAYSDYFQFLYNQSEDDDPKKHLHYLTKVMLEMRKDLGLNNKGLGKNWEMLMRALINDFDK